jgi:DNA (cytosine-5)-methyltransferase 1
MKKTLNIVDMFCGAGGESTGIMQAALERDMKVNLFAINHWEVAIETHSANHPNANHLCESVEQIDPTRVIKKGKLDLLWASPSCTHHSIARGGRPKSNQSRADAWMILRWLSELHVERVIIENVPEFLSWGPLDRNGKPIQNQKGKIFQAFVQSLQSLGYKVDWKILCAADYGAPTTRRRLFIQAVKGRKKILWPQITHIDGGNNLLGFQPWKSAREIIDWNIPGTSIFDRKKPLADTTIRRIAAGIEKYWGDYAKPFLAVLYGTSKTSPLDLPLPSITAGGLHYALINPLIMGHESGQAARTIDQPTNTVLAQGRQYLLQPFILPNEGFYRGNKTRSLDDPLNTVTSRGAGGIVSPFVFNIGQTSAKDRARSIDEPLSTVVTKAEHCLVEQVYLDIHFRMLKNHELKQAQGFEKEYILKGNTTEQTKQIGNAVPPPLGKALASAAMSA